MKVNLKSKDFLKEDFAAGLVVFLVALPLCLGIALASGAPLMSGIIAGIIGGLVIGSISQSNLSVSGPAAGLTVIVLGAISTLGGYENFLAAVVIAGVIQICLGLVKAGIIAYYFPSSVIKGMLAAIGIILIIKQLPHSVGFDLESFSDEMEFTNTNGKTVFEHLTSISTYFESGAIIICLVSLAIMLFWESSIIQKRNALKLIPGALIAVIAGISINYYWSTSLNPLELKGKHLVSLPTFTDIDIYTSSFNFLNFEAFTNPKVYGVALTLAIIASIETLLSIEATDRLDPYKRVTPPNRELIAQGIGNTISGLLGGLPVTAVIVRSSANVNAGGVTKRSTLVHGALLLICAGTLPHFLNLIPLSCLAALLLLVGYKLAKIGLFVDMYKRGLAQFLPFIATVVVIQFTDLLVGISVGMVIAVVQILLNNYKRGYFYHNENHDSGERTFIRLAEDVTFLNKGSILLTLDHVPENSKLVIDGSNTHYIDPDVLELIHEFKNDKSKRKNIEVELISIPAY